MMIGIVRKVTSAQAVPTTAATIWPMMPRSSSERMMIDTVAATSAHGSRRCSLPLAASSEARMLVS